MEKDFNKWHVLKSKIDERIHKPNYSEREVWWCSLGANVGFEEDGKNNLFERPVLIIRKFNKDIFWALPLTSRRKEGQYYLQFILRENVSTVLLSQLRILSSKRLIRKLGRIGHKQFNSILDETAKIIMFSNKNGSHAGASGA